MHDNGNVAWRAQYTVWGEQHRQHITQDSHHKPGEPSTLHCDLRFQGQLYDAESGLHYNRNRYYDPQTGQYLSPDPIGLAGGLRTQGYVHNPNEWVDPLGLSCDCGNDTSRPPNLSPEGAGRRGAFREAKRQSGIPVGQQPSSVKPNVDRRGRPQPGKQYEFDTPEGKKVIRDDAGGHIYRDDPSQNRGPHFNDEAGNHYDY